MLFTNFLYPENKERNIFWRIFLSLIYRSVIFIYSKNSLGAIFRLQNGYRSTSMEMLYTASVYDLRFMCRLLNSNVHSIYNKISWIKKHLKWRYIFDIRGIIVDNGVLIHQLYDHVRSMRFPGWHYKRSIRFRDSRQTSVIPKFSSCSYSQFPLVHWKRKENVYTF